MTTINRAPTGWLGFLGIKNFGRNPATASDVLAPTWDVSDLYYAGSRRYAKTVHTVAALGLIYESFVVPPNEVWRIDAYGIWANPLLTTSVLGLTPILYYSATFSYCPIGPNSGPFAVGTAPALGTERPYIIGSGESIGFVCTHFAAPNATVTANLVYTVLAA